MTTLLNILIIAVCFVLIISGFGTVFLPLDIALGIVAMYVITN